MVQNNTQELEVIVNRFFKSVPRSERRLNVTISSYRVL